MGGNPQLEPIHARRAYDLGLIARLARDGEALSDALTLASKLASRAPRALKAAKASIRDAADRSLSEHLCAERQRFLALLAGPEKAEGIAAFRERRDPVWPAMSCG